MHRPPASNNRGTMQVCVWALVYLLCSSASECQSKATIDAPAPTHVTIEQMSVPRRVWAGEEVEITLVVRNRRASETVLQLRWVTSAASEVLERGGKDTTISAGESRQCTFVFHAPQVRRRTKLVCQVVVATEVGQDKGSCQVSVFPPREMASLARILFGRRIGLVDFDGALHPLLEEPGIAWQDLSSPVAARHFTGELILVAASSRLIAQPLLQRELMQAAENEAGILWFGEGHPGAGFNTRLFGTQSHQQASPPAAITEAVIAAPRHPAVAELAPGDLSHWRCGGDASGLGPPLAWPEGGNFRAMARASQSGQPLVLEILSEQGSITFCQLPVLRCLASEPAAHLLLRGLLRAATMPMPQLAPAALFAAPEGRWDKLLGDIGIVADRNPELVAKGQLAIICADEESEYWTGADSSVRLEAARDHLAQGGKCLVLGAYPEFRPVLDALGLTTLVVVNSIARVVPTRVIASHLHPAMWGILAADLDSLSPGHAHMLPSSLTGLVELVKPGVIWKCSPPGTTGTIICAQLRAPLEPSIADRAVLIQMLTNLGVLIERPETEGPW